MRQMLYQLYSRSALRTQQNILQQGQNNRQLLLSGEQTNIIPFSGHVNFITKEANASAAINEDALSEIFQEWN